MVDASPKLFANEMKLAFVCLGMLHYLKFFSEIDQILFHFATFQSFYSLVFCIFKKFLFPGLLHF